MLMMVKTGFAKGNNKYVKNFDKSIKSSYIEYLEANNLYRWAMSQKLPADDFQMGRRKWYIKI